MKRCKIGRKAEEMYIYVDLRDVYNPNAPQVQHLGTHRYHPQYRRPSGVHLSAGRPMCILQNCLKQVTSEAEEDPTTTLD